MIEVIYKDEKQTAKGNEESFNLPKNIRQIGIPNEKYRIYIEDYVYTFLKKIAEKAEEEEKGAAAVFTGEIKWNSGTGYLFIRGALTAEAGEISAEHVEFSDLTWQKLHEETEHYFAGQEIIGWFLTQKSGSDRRRAADPYETFWRRKSAYADGSGRKRGGFFLL